MPARRPPKRDAELSGKPGIRKKLVEVFADVQKGFSDQRQRSDGLMDNWDVYNCKLGDAQFYNGGSRIFMPYVRDAVNARKTRFTNQIFPQAGRYVEVTTSDGEIPHATMALLESYVRKAKLRTEVMPAMCKNGDVEGQYSLYVSWKETKRHTMRREKVADVKIGRGDDALELPELGTHDEYIGDEVRIGRPDVEVLHDADLLILPVTCDSIEDAIEGGGSVTVLRRWTKGKIRKMISDGDIVKDAGEALLKAMSSKAQGENRDTGKDMADAAGIKGGGAHALGYETWTRLKIEGEWRLCRAYYGGDDLVLGCKLCPYWCDRVPVITAAVDKTAGVIKSKPPVDYVFDMQILANDTINEGADTSHYAAMPIVMTDPEKNPRVGSMVLGLAAIWETSPQDTSFAEFPELWRTAMDRAEAIKGQIFQSLGVNVSMIPQSAGKQKKNQAEIANEQQVDLLTTADAVTVIEEGILTPLVQWFAELDHQFREDPVTIRVFGEMGVRAQMEAVEPIQLNNRWEFRWFGVEAARNAAAQQQQIAGLNVMKGIPPEQYAGYTLNVAPLMVQMAENLFGPRLAPLIFVKETPITVDPELENEMLEHGHMVRVNKADDDQHHLQVHMQLMAAGDPHGTVREHMGLHMAQMEKKEKAMQQQQMAQGQGLPGSPGGAGPGVAGTPKPGAMPAGPHAMKGPAGMIHPDRMGAADPSAMPRQ